MSTFGVWRLVRPATPTQGAAYLSVVEGMETESEARAEAERASAGGETVEVWREGPHGPTCEAIFVDGEEVDS